MTKSHAIKARGTSNLSQTAADQAHDISCLEKIHALIDEFIAPSQHLNEDKRPILFQIGLQANKIKYNDASSDYIRNKYGLIDRNHQGSVRENGLEIHYLQALESVSQSLETVNDTWSESTEIWQDNLKIIQKKIGLVIDAQKSSNSKTTAQLFKSFAKLKKPRALIADIEELYCEKLTQKMQEMVTDSDLPVLDFQRKEDRYYFANSILKIGELCRESIDFFNPGKESGLFSFFKKVRNELVHNMDVMSDDLSVKKMHDLHEIRDILLNDFNVSLETFRSAKRMETIDQGKKSYYNGLIKSVFNTDPGHKRQNSRSIEEHLLRATEEIGYLNSIDENDQKKQDAILEYGTTKVVQCLNKIDAKQDANLASFIDSAHILQESWSNSIALRNKKIAHGIMRVQDTDNKHQEIQNFVASMEDSLRDLHDVYSFTKSNFPIQDQAANSFFNRNYLLKVAQSYFKLGQFDKAVFILEECVKGYENESPLIAIRQNRTLFNIITDEAQDNNFLGDLLQRGYCEISKTDDFLKLRRFFNIIVNRSLESDVFRQEIENGSSVIDAINTLPEHENQQMRILLAMPYFSTQHQILNELGHIYSYINDQEQLQRLLDKKLDLETQIYGHPLQLSIIEKSDLLHRQGNTTEAYQLIEDAAKMDYDIPIIEAESLINMAEMLAKSSDYAQAKEKLAMANEIIPTSPESSAAKIMTLLRIAEVEALYCENHDQAISYLQQVDTLMQENQATLRSQELNMLGAEELFVKAGTSVMSKHILEMRPGRDAIDDQTLGLLDKISEMTIKINHHADRRGNRSHIMQSFVDVLNASAMICFDRPDIRGDLLIKADEINELYGEKLHTTNSALSGLNVYTNIALKFREIVDCMNKGDENTAHILDDMLDNMIRFSQIKTDSHDFSQTIIPPKITDFLEQYFVRLIDPENKPEESLALVEKYKTVKDLYHLPESRNDLFLLASCKFNLPINEEQNAREAIALVIKAKSLPIVQGGVNDYILDDFRGTVHANIDEFSQAIRAYQSAKDNTDDESLKQEAQDSITNILQAFKHNKAKNTSNHSGMLR